MFLISVLVVMPFTVIFTESILTDLIHLIWTFRLEYLFTFSVSVFLRFIVRGIPMSLLSIIIVIVIC